MRHSFILEICLDSAQSALIAQNAGADRVELCANLSEGGTTPSLGMLQVTRKLIKIPLQVIIRPRGGDFCYSAVEYDVMRADVIASRQAGADGVVLGILLPNGTVDIARTRELVELARPMSVTFHRAFDMTSDPLQALEDVIKTGADRLLTSGQQKTAILGRDLIIRLIAQAAGRIIIMPGAGINAHNLAEFITATQAKEIHLSAHSITSGQMQFRPTHISMGANPAVSEFELKLTDYDKVKHIKAMSLL